MAYYKLTVKWKPNLDDTGVVQEGEEGSAEGVCAGFIVHYGHLDAFGIPTDTQAHERDLDDWQQELEAQRPDLKRTQEHFKGDVLIMK